MRIKIFSISVFFLNTCFGASQYSNSSEFIEKILCGQEYSKVRIGYDQYFHCSVRIPKGLLIPRTNLIKSNLEAYTKCGYFFEPREFWEQSMYDQMLYLKDEILKYDLLDIVKKRYTDPSGRCSSPSLPFDGPYGPYPQNLVNDFNKAVFNKLQIFTKEKKLQQLSEEDFYKSLTLKLDPKSHLYSAPLLVHFSDYLCPRYETHYESDRVKKIIRLPSEFEELIGIEKEPEVLFDRSTGYIKIPKGKH